MLCSTSQPSRWFANQHCSKWANTENTYVFSFPVHYIINSTRDSKWRFFNDNCVWQWLFLKFCWTLSLSLLETFCQWPTENSFSWCVMLSACLLFTTTPFFGWLAFSLLVWTSYFQVFWKHFEQQQLVSQDLCFATHIIGAWAFHIQRKGNSFSRLGNGVGNIPNSLFSCFAGLSTLSSIIIFCIFLFLH